MRTLLLTAAAALLFSSTDARAQGGTTTPVETKPMTTTTPKAAPADKLTEQKKAYSSDLKTTMSTAQALRSSATKVAGATKGADHDRAVQIIDGVKAVERDLNAQLNLVNGATEKTSADIFAKAKAVNLTSKGTLDRLKGELPSTKPATTPVETKPTTPAPTK